MRRILRATILQERVSTVQCTFTTDNAWLIDDSITFPSINVDWVIISHEDALMLTLGLDDFDVQRILMDLGSFTYLLQISTYRLMRCSLSTLENQGRVLSNFNEATTISLGDVVLPIEVDVVILNVWFSIVKDLSPYNTIMERSWLHQMKDILSTYHQIERYLTKVGQVDLHRSQPTA